MMVPMQPFMPGSMNRSPGRPNGNPEAQAQRDRQSQAMTELEGMLPKQAKETRFHIYRLINRSGSWMKATSKPATKIYSSEWRELGLTETDTLRAFLREKLGPGCYQITACDAHGNPMPRIPSWTEDLYNEGDSMSDLPNDMRGRGGRGRGRFRRGGRGRGRGDMEMIDDDLDDDFDDDDYMDDYPPRRGEGIMDFIETTKATDKAAAAAASAQAQAAAQGQQDTMRMLLMQSQQQRDADERRRADEATREDRRREERRTEELRLEERRREERAVEERRREEERRIDREREDRRATERTQLIGGLISAAIPTITSLLSPKKDDTMAVVLGKLLEPKPQDPLMATLLAKIMDSANSKTGIDQMLAGMAKVQEVGATMQAKQMESVMNTSQELQSKLMQQVLANLKNGGGDESVFDKILKGLPALAPLITAATAQQQPATQQLIAQQPQQVQQAAPRPAPQPAPAPAAPPAAPPQSEMPQGYDLVAQVMIALHTKRYTTEAERGQLLDLLATNAPAELKHAIASGDQGSVMSLCAPTFTGNPTYMSWLGTEGAMDFITNTAAGLQPQFAAQLGMVIEPEPEPVPAPVPAPVPPVVEVVHQAEVVGPDVG